MPQAPVFPAASPAAQGVPPVFPLPAPTARTEPPAGSYLDAPPPFPASIHTPASGWTGPAAGAPRRATPAGPPESPEPANTAADAGDSASGPPDRISVFPAGGPAHVQLPQTPGDVADAAVQDSLAGAPILPADSYGLLQPQVDIAATSPGSPVRGGAGDVPVEPPLFPGAPFPGEAAGAQPPSQPPRGAASLVDVPLGAGPEPAQSPPPSMPGDQLASDAGFIAPGADVASEEPPGLGVQPEPVQAAVELDIALTPAPAYASQAQPEPAQPPAPAQDDIEADLLAVLGDDGASPATEAAPESAVPEPAAEPAAPAPAPEEPVPVPVAGALAQALAPDPVPARPQIKTNPWSVALWVIAIVACLVGYGFGAAQVDVPDNIASVVYFAANFGPLGLAGGFVLSGVNWLMRRR